MLAIQRSCSRTVFFKQSAHSLSGGARFTPNFPSAPPHSGLCSLRTVSRHYHIRIHWPRPHLQQTLMFLPPAHLHCLCFPSRSLCLSTFSTGLLLELGLYPCSLFSKRAAYFLSGVLRVTQNLSRVGRHSRFWLFLSMYRFIQLRALRPFSTPKTNNHLFLLELSKTFRNRFSQSIRQTAPFLRSHWGRDDNPGYIESYFALGRLLKDLK